MSKEDYPDIVSRLWREIDATKTLSPSHDHYHVDRVLKFAQELQTLHGGDLEVISTAAVLHDLGRQDPSARGPESAGKSVEEAKSILQKISFPPDKTEAVLTAISEHDKPQYRPSTIEGRILKEADFLAGFGAWGILRIAMWAGETGDGFPQVIDRLKTRMPKRYASLEFPESRRQAWEDMLLAGSILSRLDQPSRIAQSSYPGKYIVLEGVSGSGKDTQADLLVEYIKKMKLKVVKTHEPTEIFKLLRATLEKPSDPVINMFLFMADRYKVIQENVIPALKEGNIVVSVRSFLSTLVYQENPTYELALLALVHRFVPPPDLLILYDVDADTAFTRIQKRKRDLGDHERIEKLKTLRKKYIEVCSKLPLFSYQCIDANASIEKVESETRKTVEEFLSLSEPANGQ